MSKLTIIMYHYVRDLQKSAFPRIKGLDISSFKRQLDFLQAKYTFFSMENLTACINGSTALPDNACWLTFDDGYSDHYEYVYPELVSRRIKGAFFPSVKPVTERKMLDVNKIHLILASVDDVSMIVKELSLLYLKNDLSQDTGKSFDDYWSALAKPGRFDSADVIFVKSILQYALPEKWRFLFSDILFKKYVSADVHAFADDFYMSSKNLSEMVQAGMYVGSHGYNHLWLGKENHQTQLEEIEKSLVFLESVGAQTDDWVMCYPHGSYNGETLEILKAKGCLAGLTTKVGVADLQHHSHLEFPRLDTNDLPK